MRFLLIHYLHIVHLITQKTRYNNYKGKDCMKKLSEDLKKHVAKIVNYEKKK